ncbi:MAG: hypothetical protein EHM61_25610 [Acidobacteria bacterium]|nr:MAG: hypothetical protein EHM61_25610 [Acidobacteriota bacterium]
MTANVLSNFLNRHRQGTIVICGCGPSLHEFHHSEDAITIGVNDVGRLFDPTYLVVVDPRQRFEGDRFTYIESSRAQVVFTARNLQLRHPRVVRFKLGTRGGTDFSNPNVLPCGQDSTYVAVCLAVHMGAARIGLIGVDLTDHRVLGPTGPHPLSRRLVTIDRDYSRLAEALSQRGIELVNLSPESRLESLPKLPCDTFLGRGVSVVRSPAKRPRARKLKHSKPPGQLRVVHVATTNCAGALWNLHQILVRYSPVQSRVVTASEVTSGRLFPKDVLLSDTDQVAQLLEEADLVHFHNWIDAQSPEMASFRTILERKPAVLQFHSEPGLLQRQFPGRDPRTRTDLLTLVVAQKHVRFYPRAVPVPNAIDIHHPLLQPGTQVPRSPIRIVYTPTDTKSYSDYSHTCRGKGYQQTVQILRELEKQGWIEATVRTGVPWEDVMTLRRESDVLIDECVTGGYHLTSLEGLSQGLATVAYLDEKTRTLLVELTGCSAVQLPWVNTPVDRLRETLLFLAENPLALQAFRRAARTWMEQFWGPDLIVEHYHKAYRRALEEFRVRPSFSLCLPPGKSNAMQSTVSKEQCNDSPVVLPEVHYELPGRARPARSEDFPQTVRLGKELLERRGTLRGAACHILGNGPSIQTLDLSLLRHRTVIGVNASPLLREALGRDADFYCVSDRRFLQDESTRRLAQSVRGSIRLFAGYCWGFLSDADINYVRILPGDEISEDLVEGFHHCCSVALFAAQLALWLGCGTIFLHGCEFDYRGGRFRRDQDRRPHDRAIYPRVAANARTLSERLQKRGSQLNVVGPSRLVGDFGHPAIPGIRPVPIDELVQRLRAPTQAA